MGSFRQTLGLLLLGLASTGAILYPRDSEGRETKRLDGRWNFRTSSITDQNQGFRDGWFNNSLSQSGTVIPMPVPASYNDITQDRAIRDFIGWAWYDYQFFVPSRWTDQRVVLRFGSVHYFAQVYLNGNLIMSHRGGHLPFEAEVTKYLQYDRANLVTVAVNNTLTQETIPQGSVKYFNNNTRYPPQFYEYSLNFDFFNYAGIHRSVILYTTPKTYIQDIVISTDIANTTTGIVRYTVFASSQTATCLISVLDKQNKVVATSKSCMGEIQIQGANLWWPYTTNPAPGYLYTLKVELNSDTTKDVHYERFGIRTVNVTVTQFLINGKPFYFAGVSKHEDANIRGKGLDWPIIIKDFNLIKWIGANSFRTSHYPYSEELMDMADEQGIVVIDECPAVGLSRFDSTLLASHLMVMDELVGRDKNRPSVVMWSIANEPQSAQTAADAYFKTVVAHTKSLDPIRPVTIAIAADINQDKAGKYLDVVMINRYFAWYSDPGYTQVILPQVLAEFRRAKSIYKKPVMISEYGADTVAGLHMNPSVMFTEDYYTEFVTEYHRGFDILRTEGGFVGELIWNFADFMTIQQTTRVVGNKKGIFTRERQPKAAAKILRCRYLGLANITITDDNVYCPAFQNPMLQNVEALMPKMKMKFDLKLHE